MENNNSIKKIFSIIGIAFSLLLFVLSGAVLFMIFFDGYSLDVEAIIYAVICIVAGILILKISIGALSKKEKKNKTINPIIIIIGCLAFCAACIFVGITSNIILLTWLGFTLIIILLAIAFSVSKHNIISKKHTEETAEVPKDKSKNSGAVVALVLILAIVIGLLLTGIVMKDEIVANGTRDGSESNFNECSACGKTYSSGSPLDGYCNNCYQKVKNIYDIYEG